MPRLSKVTTDIIGYIPATILPPVISFLGVVYFSRTLGPTVFGKYILVLVTTRMLALILQGWISHDIFRFHADKTLLPTDEARAAYRTNLTLAFLVTLGLGVGILVVIFRLLRLSPILPWLAVGAMTLASVSLFNALKMVRRATMDIVNLNKLALLGTIVSVGMGSGYLALHGPDLLGLLAFLAAGKLGVMAFFIPWKSILGTLSGAARISWPMLRTFVIYGFPLSLATIGHQIMSISNRYFIEYYHGTADVGVYSAAYELFFRTFALGFPFIGAAVMPHMMRSFDSGNQAEAARLYKKAGYLLLLFLAPTTGFAIIYGKQLLDFVFGEAYSGVPLSVIQLVTLSAFFWVMTTYQYRILMLVKKTQYNALSSLVAALLNLIGNALLIQRYGIVGAAMSTAISYTVLTIIIQRLAKRSFEFVPLAMPTIFLFLGLGIMGAWAANFLTSSLGLAVEGKEAIVSIVYFAAFLLLTFILFQLMVIWNKNVRKYEFSLLKNLGIK